MSSRTRFIKGKLPKPTGRPPLYEWHKIKAGKPMQIRNRTLASVASCAYAAGRRLGVRFALRTVRDDNGNTHVNVYLRDDAS